MPSRKVHKQIDDEILKPMHLIPADYDSGSIHGAMDEGTIHHGGLHRVMDKWHDPEYVARIGTNSKEFFAANKDWNDYRIAKVHVIADELWSRYKTKHGKNPTFDYLKRRLRRLLSNKKIVRRQFY